MSLNRRSRRRSLSMMRVLGDVMSWCLESGFQEDSKCSIVSLLWRIMPGIRNRASCCVRQQQRWAEIGKSKGKGSQGLELRRQKTTKKKNTKKKESIYDCKSKIKMKYFVSFDFDRKFKINVTTIYVYRNVQKFPFGSEGRGRLC